MIPLVIAQLADLFTGLNLPTGAEVNPLGSVLLSIPPLAAAAKFGLIVLVIEAARLNPRLHLAALGTLAGVIGAASNVRALA